jgi:mRNA-degrading endonuclease RelE of RelBE toxin-antitoxin system
VNLFHWTDAAKTDLRSIDREQALTILLHLTDYGFTGKGDVKQLKGSTDFRLRVGDYRVRYESTEARGGLRILEVKHHREAYR